MHTVPRDLGALPRDLGALLSAASPLCAEALADARACNLQLSLAELKPAARSGARAVERSTLRCSEAQGAAAWARGGGGGSGGRTLPGALAARDAYFYPASAVKLCAAVAALQRVQALRRTLGPCACDADAPLVLHARGGDAEATCGTRAGAHPRAAHSRDASNARGGTITVAHELRKLFLVSDNEAFNRLWDFAGHEAINRSMWAAGLHSARLHHRLHDAAQQKRPEREKCTPAVEVHPRHGGVGAYALPPQRSKLDVPPTLGATLGAAYVPPGSSADSDVVHAPLDFSLRNAMSLTDLQDCLIKLLAPDVRPQGSPGFGLSGDHSELLREAMAQYPCSSANPSYARERHPDEWCKFFLPGLRRVLPGNALRVYNKIGQAYGHTIDNALIVDCETGRGFFLAATVYTNANGVLNDDKYEYGRGEALLADIAEAVARAVWQLPPERSLATTALCGWSEAERDAAEREAERQRHPNGAPAAAAASAALAPYATNKCWLDED